MVLPLGRTLAGDRASQLMRQRRRAEAAADEGSKSTSGSGSGTQTGTGLMPMSSGRGIIAGMRTRFARRKAAVDGRRGDWLAAGSW